LAAPARPLVLARGWRNNLAGRLSGFAGCDYAGKDGPRCKRATLCPVMPDGLGGVSVGRIGGSVVPIAPYDWPTGVVKEISEITREFSRAPSI
jgi:hypothetical protein